MTTIPLEYPVEYGGATYSELTLKRPNGGQFAEYEAAVRERGLDPDIDKIRSSIIMLSLLAGIPEEVVKLLDAEDMTAANEAIGDFFPRRGASRGKPHR